MYHRGVECNHVKILSVLCKEHAMNPKSVDTSRYVTTYTVVAKLVRAGFKPSKATLNRWLAPVRKFRRV
jgi:hypothetical protein